MPTSYKIKFQGFLLFLESKISKLRRRISIDKQMYSSIALPHRQASQFQEKIFPDDNFYRSAKYASVSLESAKKIFLYGCARQIIKASVLLLENSEHLLGPPKKEDENTLTRAISESIIDAQNLIIRKHIELLANLINFSSLNIDESYRIFLNAENLEFFLGKKADFKDFYESESLNTACSIKMFADRIREDIKKIPKNELWFLKPDWEDCLKTVRLPLFKSVRQRYMLALQGASDEEKIFLGVSYDLFSNISVSAHASIGSRAQDHYYKFSSIRGNMEVISILGLLIVHRLNNLMGFNDPSDMIEKLRQEGGSNASTLLQKNKKIFSAGDIVLLAGVGLAEIVESKSSKYGYASCKVRFLSKPPLPNIPEDWLPSAYVISILPKIRIREFMFASKINQDFPKEIQYALEQMKKEPDEKLVKYAGAALANMHKHGILIPALIKSGYLTRAEDAVQE